MPTYDYECSACGHTFEHFQSMSSNKLRKCPECGQKKLERLFGIGSGVIFKGSGFYETDYKRAGAAGTKSSDGDAGSSDAGGGKSDSKATGKTSEKSSSASDSSSDAKPSGSSGNAGSGSDSGSGD